MFEPSPSQAVALDILTNTDDNIFLTGGAGTGKSAVIQQFKKSINPEKLAGIKTAASTGAAAILVNGCTFHSFFGLGIGVGSENEIIFKAARNRKVQDALYETDILIIDEVSMLTGRLMDLANAVAQRVRGTSQPFGGMRVICVGDFFQLPPVTEQGKPVDWAFNSTVWLEANVRTVQLKEIMRTSDPLFMEVLNNVRKGECTSLVSQFLNDHVVGRQQSDVEATRLYGKRASVDAYNIGQLKKLPGDTKLFRTKFDGDERFFEQLEKSMPIPNKLFLKPGALVMIRKNGVAGGMNGSLAKVVEIKELEGLPPQVFIEKLDNGKKYLVGPESFEWMNPKGEPVARATNFPLTLAWACTIHKSQGASLDAVYTNLADVWEPGQAYVALSRAKDPTKLFIEDWSKKGIRAHEDVVAFYDEDIASAKEVVFAGSTDGLVQEEPEQDNG